MATIKTFHTFKSHFKTKFTKTFGFSLPHWTSILIWVVGITVMFGLAVKDIYPMISDYLDEDENADVKISVKKSGALKSPPLYFCVSLNGLANFRKIMFAPLKKGANGMYKWNCSQCDALANQSWDVWNHLNESDQEPLTLQRLFLDKLFTTGADSALDLENFAWNKVIIEMAMSLFKARNALDIAFLVGNELEFDDDEYDSPDFIWNRDKTDMERIYEYIIDIFCEFLDVSYADNYDGVYNDRNESVTMCHEKIKKLSGINAKDQFCLPLPLNDSLPLTKFKLDDRYFEFYSGFNPFFIYPENPLFTASPALYESPRIEKSRGREKVVLKYGVVSKVVEKRPTVLHRCYKEQIASDCITRCKTEKITQVCDCVPFTTSNLIPNATDSDFCNSTDYKNCKQASKAFQQCSEECDNACEYYTYQWQVSSTYQEFPTPSFELFVEPFVKLPYLEFTVTVKDNSEKLIANLGGSFNFYLGLSGLSIFVFVIFILDSARRWRRSEAILANRVYSPGWHWKWMWLTNSIAAARQNYQYDQQKSETISNGKRDDFMERIEKLESTVRALERKDEQNELEIRRLKFKMCKAATTHL